MFDLTFYCKPDHHKKLITWLKKRLPNHCVDGDVGDRGSWTYTSLTLDWSYAGTLGIDPVIGDHSDLRGAPKFYAKLRDDGASDGLPMYLDAVWTGRSLYSDSRTPEGGMFVRYVIPAPGWRPAANKGDLKELRTFVAAARRNGFEGLL